MSEQAVVIGAGQAGISLAAALRRRGFDGYIRLIGAEAALPYQRPPLSKEFMASSDEAPRLIRRQSFYEDDDIDLLTGEVATDIDLAARRVKLGASGSLPFTFLAIATGGQPRRLPGGDIDGVCCLRTVADAEAIRSRAGEGGPIVIVGGGFLGLELAATLSANGHSITLLEGGERLMGRAVSPSVSTHFHGLHAGWGVTLHCGDPFARFEHDNGRLTAVTTRSGRRVPAAMAIVGIGIDPDVGIAERAGLACNGGIEVDACLSTGTDGVVAIGDCARFRQHRTGTPVRIESIQNATDQGDRAAGTLLGEHEPYRAVPWFWSNQRGERLQMAGSPDVVDTDVIRGNPHEGRFSVFRYAGGQLVAVDSVNRPAEHMLSRKLIAAGVSPRPDAVRDPDTELKSLLDA